jgi:hypothetical protein
VSPAWASSSSGRRRWQLLEGEQPEGQARARVGRAGAQEDEVLAAQDGQRAEEGRVDGGAGGCASAPCCSRRSAASGAAGAQARHAAVGVGGPDGAGRGAEAVRVVVADEQRPGARAGQAQDAVRAAPVGGEDEVRAVPLGQVVLVVAPAGDAVARVGERGGQPPLPRGRARRPG